MQNKKGDTLYSLPDTGYGWMTILVSANGERLVIIDDYPAGISFNSPALMFFNQGKLTKSYRFFDLVSSNCFCSYSVSHVNWALHDFSLSDNNGRFSLATYEFYEYEFDVDGLLINKQRPAGFDESASIVYGYLSWLRNDIYFLNIKVYVAGPKVVGNQLQFKAKHLERTRQKVLMIKDGKDITPKRFEVNYIILNLCHEKESSS